MKKDKFIEDYANNQNCEWLVIAVELPNFEVELITNSKNNIVEKMRYYIGAYNDELFLNFNPNIRIINWMFA